MYARTHAHTHTHTHTCTHAHGTMRPSALAASSNVSTRTALSSTENCVTRHQHDCNHQHKHTITTACHNHRRIPTTAVRATRCPSQRVPRLSTVPLNRTQLTQQAVTQLPNSPATLMIVLALTFRSAPFNGVHTHSQQYEHTHTHITSHHITSHHITSHVAPLSPRCTHCATSKRAAIAAASASDRFVLLFDSTLNRSR
jgi:hypothetical protein